MSLALRKALESAPPVSENNDEFLFAFKHWCVRERLGDPANMSRNQLAHCLSGSSDGALYCEAIMPRDDFQEFMRILNAAHNNLVNLTQAPLLGSAIVNNIYSCYERNGYDDVPDPQPVQPPQPLPVAEPELHEEGWQPVDDPNYPELP